MRFPLHTTTARTSVRSLKFSCVYYVAQYVVIVVVVILKHKQRACKDLAVMSRLCTIRTYLAGTYLADAIDPSLRTREGEREPFWVVYTS